MQSVEFHDIDRLLKSWDRLLVEFPQEKAVLLEDLGKQLLQEVQQRIQGTGTVQGWQSYYLGSENGYVAVRAKAKTYKRTAGGKQYAAGYVTNAIENGHRHRRPSPVKRDGYTYRARIKIPAVAGRHFYAQVRSRMEDMGQAELERLAQELVARLEGRK